ncbi:MAG: tetratricopeptide repeat protein [Candidatus Thorarchaeota archaeon]
MTTATTSDMEDWLRYLSMHRESLSRNDLKETIDAMRDGDLERAEKHCRELIEMSGGADPTLWGVFALYHIMNKDLEQARIALDRAMELAPEELFIVNLAGDFFCFKNDFENGETFYLLSLEIDPDQLHPRVMLSNRYSAYQLYDEAVGVLLPILGNHLDDDEVWLNLRVALSGLSEKREKKLAHAFMQDFPNHYHAWCIMGHSLMRRGKFDEALKYCKRAISARKNDTLAWNMYATLLNMQGKHRAALLCQKKSFELTGHIPSAMSSLATAHYLAGEVDEAMRMVEELKTIDMEEAIQLLEYIEEWEMEKKEPRSERRRRSRNAKKRKK